MTCFVVNSVQVCKALPDTAGSRKQMSFVPTEADSLKEVTGIQANKKRKVQVTSIYKVQNWEIKEQ